MKKFLFALTFVLFIGAGCTRESNLDCIVADIDVDKDFRDSVSIFDIVSKVELIELEHTEDAMVEPLFRIFQPVIDASGMYFMEGDNSNYIIKHFDLNGKWLGNIRRSGRGHGEYSSPTSIWYNRYDDKLEIFNHSSQSIFGYNPADEYRFSGSIAVNDTSCRIYDAYPISESRYLLSGYKGESSILLLLDGSSEKPLSIDSDVVLPSAISGNNIWRHHFYRYGDKLRDVSPYDGSIYAFDETSNSFVPYFKWNLGKYNMPAEVIDKEVARGRSFFYFSDELPKILKEKYITCCKNTCESENYIISLFSITTYDNWMIFVYNKKTNTPYCFVSELAEGHYFCPDGPVYDNVLYRVMPFFWG